MSVSQIPSSVVIAALLLFSIKLGKTTVPKDSASFLEPGDVIHNDKPGLQVFCHRGQTKYLANMWKTLTIHINSQIDTYDFYEGKSATEVIEKYEENQRSWRFSLWGTKRNKEYKINSFEDTCIGIYIHPSSIYRYSISMSQTRVDVSRLTMMLLGIIMYWSAHKLSRNPVFYYLCGITIGVTTSVLILIYLISKLLPRGKVMYLMVATGWTMSLYLAQALVENAQLIVVQYKNYVLWYILGTAFISFLLCYRFGPVTNPRTKKIIQWFLQGIGLLMMYYSSYFREASLACCILLVLLYNFPIVVIDRGRNCWKNMFPERRRLLTDDQYRKEGIRETRKALKELQNFCSSPECNPWKTVLRLKDPIRFAKFMEGEFHLSDDEIEQHDHELTKILDAEYTDESDNNL